MCNSTLRVAVLTAMLVAASGGAFAKADEAVPNEPPLRWWKGNLHTHSLWSDGNDFPEMIAEWYRTHDYQFLALTDHNILSDGMRWMKHADIVQRGGKEALEKYQRRFGNGWVETRGEPSSPNWEVRLKPLGEFRALVEERGRFLMIEAEEISDRAEGKPVHLNATNLQRLLEPVGGGTVREAIANNLRAAAEQALMGGREILIHVNHPNFGLAVTAEDLAAIDSARFFEVYNGHPGVNHLGVDQHVSVEVMWDIVNALRISQLKTPPLMGLATDDSHVYHGERGARTGRGWIMVRARYLTPEHLIRAIKAGDFYASSGVVLNDIVVDRAAGVLRLEIAAEAGVEYTTQFIGTPARFDLASQPRVDKAGQPLRATRQYSAEIGRVLATIAGTQPQFTLSDQNLYVRAVVTANRPHPDPSFAQQKQQAWTQPIGWEQHLQAPAEVGASGE
jgi:hypothetical protein